MVNPIDKIIQRIKNYAESDVQNLIVELQQKRFANQGAFNDNKKWEDNSSTVQRDKGRNEPLVDTGALKKSLTTKSNWDLKPHKQQNSLKLTIPETERFTDSKYDKLQTGTEKSQSYISTRGNKVFVNGLPERNFKDLSDQDAEWIVNELVNIIVDEIKQ